MKQTTIYEKFDKSINWNAYLYIVQKFLKVFLTSIFFKELTTQEFSIWANINSIIFIVLLWSDFGFGKSVPYYMNEFAKDKSSHNRFTRFIIFWKLIAMGLAFIIAWVTYKPLIAFLGINIPENIALLGAVIFFLEGFILLFQLIYYSHFWNKEFNLFYSIILIAETITNLIFLFYISDASNRLEHILIIKIVINFFILAYVVILLRKLYDKNSYANDKHVNYKQEIHNFIKHTLNMWLNNCLKSLTERNFLVPLLTHIIGPAQANLFKMANDWAIVFQRGILKSIGSSDTTLFSHEKLNHNNKNIDGTFTKIVSKIFELCVPLLGIFVFLVFNREYFMGKDQIIFNTFLVLVCLYIMESIFSPYERILEVNKNYFVLFVSHIIFVPFAYVFTFIKVPNLSLTVFLASLFAVRLVSFLIIVISAKRIYKLKLPILFKKKVVSPLPSQNEIR